MCTRSGLTFQLCRNPSWQQPTHATGLHPRTQRLVHAALAPQGMGRMLPRRHAIGRSPRWRPLGPHRRPQRQRQGDAAPGRARRIRRVAVSRSLTRLRDRGLATRTTSTSLDLVNHIVKYLGESAAQRRPRHLARMGSADAHGASGAAGTPGRTRHIHLPKYYRTQQHGNLARPGQVWFAWCRSEGISLPMILANGPERPSQLSSY